MSYDICHAACMAASSGDTKAVNSAIDIYQASQWNKFTSKGAPGNA
jgi:hypothetical protein